MSLYCESDMDGGGGEWYWTGPSDETPLATKRGRRCCSCKTLIKVGETSRLVERLRPPTEFEEERGIAYDQVYMTNWYLCEKCGDLADSLTELKFCYTLGKDSLKKQINEYMAEMKA
jgi:hypothetical protein